MYSICFYQVSFTLNITPICNIYSSNVIINDYGFYATHEVISFIIFLHILQLFLSAIKVWRGGDCFELDRIYFLIFYFTIPSVTEKKSLFFMNTFFVGPSHIQHVFPRAFLHPTYTNFSPYSLPFCGFTIPQRQWKDCLLTPEIVSELTDPFDNTVRITFPYSIVRNLL